MNKWNLASVNFTPDKTVIKVTNTSISVKNVGCKGKTEKECKYYLERI